MTADKGWDWASRVFCGAMLPSFPLWGRIPETNGMLSLTRYALNLLQGRTLLRPDLMLQQLLGPVWEYGRKISGLADLRLTFVLNALTPVDWALWQLYARQRQMFSSDCALLPPGYAGVWSSASRCWAMFR